MLTHLLSRHSTFQVPGTRHAHAPALPTFHISSTGHTTCSRTCSPDIPHFKYWAHDMLTHLLSRHSTFQFTGTRHAHAPALPTFHISSPGHTICLAYIPTLPTFHISNLKDTLHHHTRFPYEMFTCQLPDVHVYHIYHHITFPVQDMTLLL